MLGYCWYLFPPYFTTCLDFLSVSLLGVLWNCFGSDVDVKPLVCVMNPPLHALRTVLTFFFRISCILLLITWHLLIIPVIIIVTFGWIHMLKFHNFKLQKYYYYYITFLLYPRVVILLVSKDHRSRRTLRPCNITVPVVRLEAKYLYLILWFHGCSWRPFRTCKVTGNL
jgi:hypothetical protein